MVAINQCSDLGIGLQFGTFRMFHEGTASSLHLLLKQLAAKSDEHTTASNPTDVFIMVHGAAFKWNQPPSSVHGGLSTSRSGGVRLSSLATRSLTSALVKSIPVVKSQDLHEPPTPSTSGANLGGLNTSATKNGFSSTTDLISVGASLIWAPS